MQQVVAQIPWGRNLRILDAVDRPEEREWYVRQTVENGWSRDVLVHQIKSGFYHRQGQALTNFERTLPVPQSELARHCSKTLHVRLPHHRRGRARARPGARPVRARAPVPAGLGVGFAFVGSQHRLEVGGQDFYLDLLFYHLRLGCYVVIDLKVTEFQPDFAGKMNFYLSAVDEQLRHGDDGPSIGIILCKTRNRVIVEYALRDTNKPMGVSAYQITESLPKQLKGSLPSVEELEAELSG